MNQAQALKTARSLIEQAQEKVNTACVVLRRNGFPEVADDLNRLARTAKEWNAPHGYLAQVEAQCDEEDAA